MKNNHSENYLKKAIKLYGMLSEELKEGLEDFNNIKQSLEIFERQVKDLQNETAGQADFDALFHKSRIFKERLQLVEALKIEMESNLISCKEKYDQKNYVKDDISVEELETLESQTGFLISVVIETLDNLKPVREGINQTFVNARCFIDGNPDCEIRISQIMERVYISCGDAKTIIEKTSDKILHNSKEGRLYEIIVEDAVLKANIDFLKKQKNKR